MVKLPLKGKASPVGRRERHFLFYLLFLLSRKFSNAINRTPEDISEVSIPSTIIKISKSVISVTSLPKNSWQNRFLGSGGCHLVIGAFQHGFPCHYRLSPSPLINQTRQCVISVGSCWRALLAPRIVCYNQNLNGGESVKNAFHRQIKILAHIRGKKFFRSSAELVLACRLRMIALGCGYYRGFYSMRRLGHRRWRLWYRSRRLWKWRCG